MSENLERDTHFANFAKLLWDELVNLNEYGYIDVNDWDDGTDPTNYRKLIAQRAYDLKQHIMRHIDDHELQASHIPDMIAWPEPGTEQEQDIF